MKRKFVIIVILLASFCVHSAKAATLRFSPYTNSYEVDDTFIVNINVSSPDESLNAVSGAVTFPKDKLEVVSISKTNSILNFWMAEPKFSNVAGSIYFEGVVLNPGFIGETGKILSIIFKAKAAGVANVNFKSGSVLASDGKGSDILTGFGKAEFSLKDREDIDNGLYSVSVVAASPISGNIVEPSFIDKCAYWGRNFLYLFTPMMILVLILVFILLIVWYKFRILKRSLKKKGFSAKNNK